MQGIQTARLLFNPQVFEYRGFRVFISASITSWSTSRAKVIAGLIAVNVVPSLFWVLVIKNIRSSVCRVAATILVLNSLKRSLSFWLTKGGASSLCRMTSDSEQ
jgi:hypothetical protein